MIADDSRARARIEQELDATFLVEAAAGTGKTTCLVSRLVALIGAGADIQSIVAVTFTDKAAGELRLRLRAGLEQAKLAAEGARRAAYSDALAGLERARVSTIHRFASDLLRQRPIEAGVDPAFVPCAAPEQRALIAEAFGRWLERVENDPSPALRRYFARPSASVYALRSAAERLIEHRHLDAAWARRPIDLDVEMSVLFEQARAVAEQARRARSKSDRLYVSLAPLLDLAARLARHELRERDGEAALVELARTSFGRDKGYGRYADGVDRAELYADVSDFKLALEAFVARASADLAVSLREELWEVATIYRELKAKRGALDFDDLLILARDLFLRDPKLLEQTRGRLRHFFVDEFQDTDSSQVSLLLLLASQSEPTPDPLALDIAPGKLFMVGDPKQSIYRFRQADPGTYFLMRERVIECGGEVLHLNASFRSAPSIVGYVNAAFTPIMAGDREAEQAEYVALSPRCPEPDDPSVFALAVPRPYGKQRLAKSAVRKSHPDTVAGFIAWLIEKSGYRVRDPRSGERVPVRPEHVAVLFRQFESYGEHRPEVFSRGLSQHGIPHVVLGGRALGDRDESHALVTALTAIEYPDDPLLVYGTLRGPLFGFTDETLFRWHLAHGGLRPLAMPITAWSEALFGVGDALTQLGRLHFGRNRRSPAETLADLLGLTRAAIGFALSPAAEQAFLQIGALEQLAMAHERGGGLSFRSFVDSLADSSLERGTDAEDLDADAGGVRLLTVYRAKGLEFPVVVLADPSISAYRDPDKLVDAKRGLASLTLAGCAPWELLEGMDLERRRAAAEAARVAYVAATRARDMLVIPVIGDHAAFPEDGWIAPLTAALAPAAPRAPAEKRGHDSVLKRPDDVDCPSRSIVPGIHAMPWGRLELVDPAVVERQGRDRRSVALVDLITKTAGSEIVAEGRADLASFTEARNRTLAKGARAPYLLESVTARSKREGHGDVSLASAPRAPDRPRGKRFGTLVHNLMATAALDASDSEIGTLAVAIGRLVSATDDEARAAAVAARTALRHPLLERARAAERMGLLHREVPITLRLSEPSYESAQAELVDGIIDLSFEEDGVVQVVDYKTDDPAAMTSEHLNVYRAQVSLYVRAILAATGRPAEATLLFI